MKHAAVVTVGDSRRESLGAMKLARWLRRDGWEVEETTDVGLFDDADLFAFSCVFSWHLPKLVRMAKDAKAKGAEVWIGGPAVTFSDRNAKYVERERPPTVAQLLDHLRGCVGAHFEGYKGGTYLMARDTPVWVSNYGNSSHTAVTGVTGEYSTIITTMYLPY